jgi:protein-S-isoprenylcysteine O-methyltransferase Ste14
MGVRGALGKVLYALVFVAFLPVALAAWAHALGPSVTLRAVSSVPAGALVAGAGALLVVAGMHALWTHGGGLPMNAFPPPRLVTRGVYAVTRHPIYVGFVLACAGVSMAGGSAAGLWVVTPLVALGAVALVYGYELADLRARFGALPAPALRVPQDDARAPTWGERLGAYALVLVPWAVLYEAVAFLGPPPDAIDGTLAVDRALGVVPGAEALYASAYVVVLAVPLVVTRARDLRAFMIRGLLSMALVFPLYFAIPLVAPPRSFEAHTLLGRMLLEERALDTPSAAFPSFHVVWALLAAEALGARGSKVRAMARAWAWAVAASCALTGMHTVIDVAGGGLVVILVVHARAVWESIRSLAERVANSWHEVRLGPARIINHAAWAAASAFVGLAIVGALSGRAYLVPSLIAAACGLVGAGLWAQALEGSSVLLRPYGFYGGLLGVIAGALACPLLGRDPWVLLAAYAVAAPWVQSLGRLRCLVQGCCHGRAAPPSIGIRYAHPRSRVCRVPELTGVPIHPTPLYSILWNGFVGLVVARTFSLGAPMHLVGGLYLVLGGLGRFVEESLRGEPQTSVIAGLRIYQWLSVAQVAAGMLVSALGRSGPCPSAALSDAPFGAAAIGGLVVGLALGMDFPDSNRRFSRLA